MDEWIENNGKDNDEIMVMTMVWHCWKISPHIMSPHYPLEGGICLHPEQWI